MSIVPLILYKMRGTKELRLQLLENSRIRAKELNEQSSQKFLDIDYRFALAKAYVEEEAD